MATFYERLKELSNIYGMSPTAAAMKCGFSNATATHWKNGKTPRAKAIKDLCEMFGVSQACILGFEDIPEHLVQPSQDKTAHRLPVLADVAAGIPIDAIIDNDIDDWEEIPEQLDEKEYFALRIKGDSMAPRMLTGDVVLVHIQPDIEDGEIAIVGVNGDCATCKRVRKSDQGIFLCSLNPAYEPMFFSNAEIESCPVRIYGKVVELRAKFH